MSHRICIAQVGFDATHIDHHLDKLTGIVDAHHDADLIVFPELILQGHPSVEEPEGFLYRQARVVYGKVSSKMYRHIRQRGAAAIFGEIRRRVDSLYNVATYVDPDVTQHYVKTHVHWTERFVPGNRLRLFDTRLGATGINICFDAAFSEVWRTLAVLGARLAVNISAVPGHFPVELMHRRMAAAALNNQMFVVYANRPGPLFSGHSAVFDPRGRRIAETRDGEGSVLEVEIDLAEVDAWRTEEAVFPHRRPKLYRPLLRRDDLDVERPEGRRIEPEQQAPVLPTVLEV